jgi:tripartite-type tricarboxylate transporter receptor subunit TctC
MPDVRKWLESQGQVPFISTPEEMAKLLEDDAARFARAIRDANIRIEQ